MAVRAVMLEAMLVAIFVTGRAIGAQPATPSIAFADPKPIAVSWSTLGATGIDVELRSSDVRARTVAVELTDVMDAGGVAQRPGVLSLRGATVRLPAKAGALVHLAAAAGSAPPPGRYTGILVAHEGRDSAFAALVLTVAPPRVVPRVARWNIKVVRRCLVACPGRGGMGDDALVPVAAPLADGVTASRVAPEFAGGMFVRAPRDAGYLTADSILPGAGDGPRLRLRRSGFASAGDYTGRLAIRNGAGDSSLVDVAVRVHDAWDLAVLCILAGLAAAIGAEAYASTIRPAFALERRAAALPKLAESADESFSDRIAGAQQLDAKHQAALSGYTIAADVVRLGSEVATAARQFRRSPFTPLTAQNLTYAARLKDVDVAEVVVRAWPDFADELAALELALAAAEAFAAARALAPAESTAPKPLLFDTVDELLTGVPLALDAADARRGAVRDYTALLPGWQALQERRLEQQSLVDRLLAPGHAALSDLQRQSLDAAAASLEQAQVVLWERPTKEAIMRAAPTALIDAAELAIAPLRALLGEQAPAVGVQAALRAAGAAGALTAAPQIVVPRGAPETAATLLTRARRIDLLVFERDIVWLLLAVFVALIGGLNMFYFDKAFGSVQSYLSAFAAGFAARTGLDILAGLARLFDRSAVRA